MNSRPLRMKEPRRRAVKWTDESLAALRDACDREDFDEMARIERRAHRAAVAETVAVCAAAPLLTALFGLFLYSMAFAVFAM
jgi:hypothetical protein